MECRLVFILNDLAFFMFEKVIQGHVRMKDEWSCISDSHCKCIASKGQSCRAKRKMFSSSCFCILTTSLFRKKNPEETCYVGPGNNYFLGYGLWFSLATATGLLLLEICAADYKSQTALWLTALVTVTEPWKKNKHKKNVKDLECKITNLRRRGAVRSARFSSVDFKGRPCSLPACCTANCIRFVCFYLSVFASSLHSMRW